MSDMNYDAVTAEDETAPVAEPEAEAAEAAESTPYLTRAKMLPVEGVVYCLHHGAVHDDTTDPYRYGEPECSKDEHRPVYYRARKGDIDESVEAEMYGEPAVGESHGVSNDVAAVMTVDSLSAVQDKVKARIITAAAASQNGALTGAESDVVLGMVRVALATTTRNRAETISIFGSYFDTVQHDRRIELLENVRGKLED
jgi:hypothetical protein